MDSSLVLADGPGSFPHFGCPQRIHLAWSKVPLVLDMVESASDSGELHTALRKVRRLFWADGVAFGAQESDRHGEATWRRLTHAGEGTWHAGVRAAWRHERVQGLIESEGSPTSLSALGLDAQGFGNAKSVLVVPGRAARGMSGALFVLSAAEGFFDGDLGGHKNGVRFILQCLLDHEHLIRSNQLKEQARLGDRDRHLLQLQMQEQSCKEMARHIGKTPKAVEHLWADLCQRLGVSRRVDALHKALAFGLLD